MGRQLNHRQLFDLIYSKLAHHFTSTGWLSCTLQAPSQFSNRSEQHSQACAGSSPILDNHSLSRAGIWIYELFPCLFAARRAQWQALFQGQRASYQSEPWLVPDAPRWRPTWDFSRLTEAPRRSEDRRLSLLTPAWSIILQLSLVYALLLITLVTSSPQLLNYLASGGFHGPSSG